jgi:magnesium transporter
MISSFIFSEGNVVGEGLDVDALRLVRADKGLHIWVDLDNPSEEEARTILGGLFEFHPLAVEDVLSDSQFPKVDDFGDYIYVIFHGVDYSKEAKFSTAELDLFLGKDFLVTCHFNRMPALHAAVERIKQQKAIKAKTIDRVAYRILDGMVQNYQPLLNDFALEVQGLEDVVFAAGRGRHPTLMQEFRSLRRDLMNLQQIIRPQREVISRIAHGEFKIIRPYLLPYFRDINDNLRRIEGVAHGFNEQLLLSLDIYLNKAANETNDVIKVLTVLTALTTPSMLLGTWYGMNFEDMPELKWPYSYPVAAFITVVSTILLLWWLKSRKWI